MKRRAQHGMAIVLAMLLIALAASTAALMLSRHDLWMRQVETFGARAQADALARAGIDWAQRALMQSAGGADPQAFRDAASLAARSLSTKGLELDISYRDPQSHFNLNNLVRGDRASTPDVQAFQQLLKALKLPADLAYAVVDEIDGDSEVTPGGAEDLDYLAMNPPRRAANRPLMDAAHIARVKGFTPDAVARALPFLTALPEPTPINVNTVPVEALAALIPGLDVDAAKRIDAARRETPFTSLSAFRAKLPGDVVLPPGAALTIASRYFLVTSRARFGRAEIAYEALIGARGAAQTGVIWRRESEG